MIAVQGRHLGMPREALPHLEQAYQITFSALFDRICQLETRGSCTWGDDFLVVTTPVAGTVWAVQLDLEARAGGWWARMQRGVSFERPAMQIAVWRTGQKPTLHNLEVDALEGRLDLYAHLVQEKGAWGTLAILKWNFTVPLLLVLDCLISPPGGRE